MVKKLMLVILALGLVVAWAYAQEQNIEPVIQSQDTMDVAESDALCEGCVSLDFQGADIRNVLQILSYKSGVNIVAGPEVTGLVTIQLTNVPWEDALEVILGTYGYGYEEKGSILTVTTIENLKTHREDAILLADQEPITTKTFVLDYANASEVIPAIEKMLTSKGNLTFDQRTNIIIVTDTSSSVRSVAEVVDRLDTTTPQVLIEAKIIETSLGDQENLGIDWSLKATISGAARPTYYPFTEASENKYMKAAGSTSMDFPVPNEDLFSFGTLDFSEVSAVMEILKNRSDTEILSSPSIVTLDNQMARIVVGNQYPLPEYTYNEEQAKLQVSGWEYKDIGIIFEVTPHVNNIGFVTLKIEPKITAILDYVQVENTSVPRLSTEEASTKVMIQDGQTLVIAGLIKHQLVDTQKKVPLLGDIPLLGLLFRKSEKQLNKSELLIFITPHIITENIPDNAGLLSEKIDALKVLKVK
ncbi:MAG: type IV pilus secretin PilQ [Candidatus Aceula meridiana]|nr:type IV pilus secretin PilQ [Candidatus Aceula meridiana]